MATQISTSSTADATATSGAPMVVAAPSDATINALYFDDANGGPHLATSASPYTSWSTQGIGSATHRNSQGLITLSNDNLDIFVTSPANGPAEFTAARSGGAWSPAFINLIDGTGYEADNVANGVASWTGLDSQGRWWVLGVDDIAATYQTYCDYLPSGGAWTASSPIEGMNLGEQNRYGIAAAFVGNYLVIVYDSGSGGLSYRRIDVHGASLGSWSAGVAVGSIADVTTASVLALAAIPGGSTAMLVYSGSNGISALKYDAGADTWGSATVLSSATSDRHPTLIPGASGIVYAVWCQFAAANSYALVGKGYNGSTWGTKATLEASGNNIAWPNGTYLTSGPKLALIWTQGTANPWSVEFDSVNAPSTGGTVSGGGSLVANAMLSDTAQIVAPGALVANAVLSASGQIVAGAAMVGNAVLSQTGAIVQAMGDALVANAVLAQPNGAQIVAVAALVANAILLGPVPSTVGSVALSASAPSCALTAAALGTVALSAAVSE